MSKVFEPLKNIQFQLNRFSIQWKSRNPRSKKHQSLNRKEYDYEITYDVFKVVMSKTLVLKWNSYVNYFIQIALLRLSFLSNECYKFSGHERRNKVSRFLVFRVIQTRCVAIRHIHTSSHVVNGVCSVQTHYSKNPEHQSASIDTRTSKNLSTNHQSSISVAVLYNLQKLNVNSLTSFSWRHRKNRRTFKTLLLANGLLSTVSTVTPL